MSSSKTAKEAELTNAMNWLGEQDRTIFLGQNICFPSSQLYTSLLELPYDKKIEMPVAEELQMGISLGMSLEGYIPISVYPRMDFLVLAFNQLINHVDKVFKMSNGLFSPSIIVRTQVGHKRPMDAGYQHTQDHTEALKLMCSAVMVKKITSVSDIMLSYQNAYHFALEGVSSVIVEDI